MESVQKPNLIQVNSPSSGWGYDLASYLSIYYDLFGCTPIHLNRYTLGCIGVDCGAANKVQKVVYMNPEDPVCNWILRIAL